jgi:membrane protein implicated in regulation of membrane protease activity
MISILTIYLLIAIVCAVLLVVMAALGGFGASYDVDMGPDADIGHYDAGHGDYSGSHLSPLSIPILLAFGATFGAMGAILEGLVSNEYMVFGVAILVGVLVAGGMYWLVYALILKSQASTHTSMKDFVGLEGLLTIAIKSKEPGQVVINTENRGRVPVAATSNQDIEANTQVKVIGITGDAVMVEKKEG